MTLLFYIYKKFFLHNMIVFSLYDFFLLILHPYYYIVLYDFKLVDLFFYGGSITLLESKVVQNVFRET